MMLLRGISALHTFPLVPTLCAVCTTQPNAGEGGTFDGSLNCQLPADASRQDECVGSCLPGWRGSPSTRCVGPNDWQPVSACERGECPKTVGARPVLLCKCTSCIYKVCFAVGGVG